MEKEILQGLYGSSIRMEEQNLRSCFIKPKTNGSSSLSHIQPMKKESEPVCGICYDMLVFSENRQG